VEIYTQNLDAGLLDEVRDKNSFIIFVKALANDKREETAKEKVKPSNPYGSGSNGWENGTIEDYLDSAIAWYESSDKKNGNDGSESWQQFARFLYMGKIYE
jgi:hypothetical protein